MKQAGYTAAVLAILFVFAACSAPKQGVEGWPENTFTAQIAEPEFGKVAYVYDFSQTNQYGIVLSDITTDQEESYIESLKAMGYEYTQTSHTQIPGEISLYKDSVSVRLSCSEGSMMITVDTNGVSP